MGTMRLTATVVGNTLALDEDAKLPEGAKVELVLRVVEGSEESVGQGFVLTPQMEAELAEADAEIDRGEYVSAEESLRQLRASLGL